MNAIVPYDDSNGQLFIFRFGYVEFRAFNVGEESWFFAPDATRSLGYVNSTQAITDNVEPQDKGYIVYEPGRDIPPISPRYTPGSIIVINESGLYDLVMGSKKKEAKDFKHFVTHEVLPSLRKTGKYELATKPTSQLQVLEQMMAVFSEQQRQIAALDQKQAEQAMQIESITDRLNDADYYTVKAWCLKQRIKYTVSLLSLWGREATKLSRYREIERKDTIEDGRPVGRYHKSILMDVCKPKPTNDNQPYLLPKGE